MIQIKYEVFDWDGQLRDQTALGNSIRVILILMFWIIHFSSSKKLKTSSFG